MKRHDGARDNVLTNSDVGELLAVAAETAKMLLQSRPANRGQEAAGAYPKNLS